MTRLVGRAHMWGLLLLLVSAPAYADGFLAPFIGDNFGGNAFGCAGLADCSPKRTDYGVALGLTGASLGFEEDLSYTKDFFGTAPGASSVFSAAMSNALFLGSPGKVRSYVAAGLGLCRVGVSLNQTSVNKNVLGYDLGGGANVLFATHFGVRGDLRYLHTLQDADVLILNGKVAFWRASVGLVLSF